MNEELNKILENLPSQLLLGDDEWAPYIAKLPIGQAAKNSLCEVRDSIIKNAPTQDFNSRLSEMQVILMGYTNFEFDANLKRTESTDQLEALAVTINIIGEELKSYYETITSQDAILRADSEKLSKLNEELKIALSTQKFLTRELHHRVKNNLQFISSLLWFHIKDTSNEELHEAFSSLENKSM